MKKLQGTLQPCRTNPAEWNPPAGAPPVPDDLSPAEGKVWQRLCELLVPPGVVTVAEGPILEAYVRALCRAREADAVLRKDGLTVATQNGCQAHPCAGISRRNWDAVARIGGLLGLDPSSRSKLQVPKAKEADPMQAFLSGKDRALSVVK